MNCLDSILSLPMQNDQQFIQTMITQGRKKRKLEDDGNLSNAKIRRITIKNEPEQVIYSSKILSKVSFLSHPSIPHRLFYSDIQPINQLLCVRTLFVIVYHQLKRHLY
jgi:hypothetical protein